MTYQSTYKEVVKDGVVLAIVLEGSAMDEMTGISIPFIHVLKDDELTTKKDKPEDIKEILKLELAEAGIKCKAKVVEMQPTITEYKEGDKKHDDITPTKTEIDEKIAELESNDK
jgi:hypothetical protein